MKILQTDRRTGKSTILQVVKMIASTSYVVAIVTCTVNAIMSPVAVVGNALILMANLEEPVTPNYFLHSSWWILA